jgi:pSer/pThr/pTyr-binding forkhead associated (FHA) protein
MRRALAAEAQERSDAETPEALATPSRGSRKRARASDISAAPAVRNTKRKTKDTRILDREDTDGTELQEASDNETEPSTPTEQEIISCLKVAEKHVNATEDFANDLLEGQENVPGYGKIAGRDWVFIIRKIEVNIGRPEAHERLSNVEQGGQLGTPTARTVVDIDLGPDRQVSRLHAIISYDADSMQWYIVVNGRNGLRVDNNLLKRGTKSYLRNGSVIEIANTQMAFITTATENNDGPVWDASILRQAQKSSEEDDDDDDDPRTSHETNNPHSAARNQLQDKSLYRADHDGQQGSQQQNRTHPHSQQTTLPILPGTPMRHQHLFLTKSSPSASASRGLMMESTESIDYSADNAKDLKPPHSYAQLIGMAILSTADQQMTLSNIYKWIMANYSFYRFNTGGWQNSIRHNLSLNKAFTKVARRTDEPGKGMKWVIEPTEFDNFVQQGMKGCRRPNPIPGAQSNVSSPTSPGDRAGLGGRGHEDSTPPLNSFQTSFPTATEAFTPERGPKRSFNSNVGSSVGLGIERHGATEFDFAQRTPRNGYTAAANAAGSPPTLYVNEGTRVGPLDTPFPLRPTQRLAPPSTLRRPSDFIQFSSPAPFWKMEGLIGSTPFKPYDLSPLKTPFPSLKKRDADRKVHASVETPDAAEDDSEGKVDEKGDHAQEAGTSVIGSSSPPQSRSVDSELNASPTASRPATAVARTLSQMAASGGENPNSEAGTPPLTSGTSAAAQQTPPLNASMQKTTSTTPVPVPAHADASPVDNEPAHPQPTIYSTSYVAANASLTPAFHMDDGEEDGIDLVKYVSRYTPHLSTFAY